MMDMLISWIVAKILQSVCISNQQMVHLQSFSIDKLSYQLCLDKARKKKRSEDK